MAHTHEHYLKRYAELDREARRYSDHFEFGELQPHDLIGWRVKVRHLLRQSLGDSSEHLRDFRAIEDGHIRSGFEFFHSLWSVLWAAMEDYAATCRSDVEGEAGPLADDVKDAQAAAELIGGVAKESESNSEKRAKWLAQAMLLVRDHPDWSDRKIAAKVGVHPSTLTRSKEYQAAAAMARGAKGDVRRGHVSVDPDSGLRNLDAYADDPAERDFDA